MIEEALEQRTQYKPEEFCRYALIYELGHYICSVSLGWKAIIVFGYIEYADEKVRQVAMRMFPEKKIFDLNAALSRILVVPFRPNKRLRRLEEDRAKEYGHADYPSLIEVTQGKKTFAKYLEEKTAIEEKIEKRYKKGINLTFPESTKIEKNKDYWEKQAIIGLGGIAALKVVYQKDINNVYFGTWDIIGLMEAYIGLQKALGNDQKNKEHDFLEEIAHFKNPTGLFNIVYENFKEYYDHAIILLENAGGKSFPETKTEEIIPKMIQFYV